MATEWLSINRQGLAKTLDGKGRGWVLNELIQNAIDEDGVTKVSVSITREESATIRRSRYATVIVEDNAPDGFVDLSHAYTLFGESPKKDNPLKRGRFDAGEKFVLALCREAKIESVTGTVTFNAQGRKVSRSKKIPVGTRVTATMRFTAEQMLAALDACDAIIPPAGIELQVNNRLIRRPKVAGSFPATLPTIRADNEGNLHKTSRKTTVCLYEVAEGQEALVYEMGIPICTTGGDDLYHYDVGQKVPLGLDRDSVTPAYLRTLRVAATNECHEGFDADTASSGWVREAASDERITEAAFSEIQDQRFGSKRVTFDMSDPEANKIAMAKGHTIVYGGSQSPGEHKNNRRFRATQPAGKVTPSPKPYDPDGAPLQTRNADSVDESMFVAFAQAIAEVTIGRKPEVRFASDITWPVSATFGPGADLVVNIGRLGRKFFASVTPEIIELLLHEYSHETVSDHLSYKFADQIGKLGAKLACFIAQQPDSYLATKLRG